jgi:hypothetical protein
MSQTKAQLLGPVLGSVSGDVNFDSGTLFVDHTNNRVGIGTSSPTSPLDLYRITYPEIRVRSASVTSTFGVDTVDNFVAFGSTSNHDLRLYTGGSSRLTIISSGNIGIGTTNPATNLHVYGNVGSGGNPSITVSNAATNLSYASLYVKAGSVDFQIYSDAAGDTSFGVPGTIIRTNSNTPIIISPNSTEKIRITSSGLVGINTTVYPNAEKLVVDNVGGTAYNSLFVNSSTDATTYAASTWRHVQSGTAIGYVGVGGTNVNNSSFRNTFVVGTQNATPLVLNTNDGEKLRITSLGDVGIGTTIPFVKTHIEINTAAGAGSGNAGVLWLRNANQTANNSATIFAGNNSSQACAGINFVHKNYTTNEGEISFDTRLNSSTYSEKVRITSSGNVNISNGNIVFATSGTGIDFSATSNSSGTMTSELLDDYEQGTWTPTLPNGGTLITNQARYVKIGNIVHVYCFISSVVPTNNSSLFAIGGLPYSQLGGSTYSTGSIGYSLTANVNDWRPLVETGSPYIFFHIVSGSAARRTNANWVSIANGQELIMTISYFT